ncbi:uncharacterized protein DS421_13g412700 [Arachis hypogaea]|nr:uncharacterized protein DS421_13g412700 [Arachis hypogaea]
MLRTYRVDTLDALKTVMLSNMGGVGTKEVGRVAYRFLYALSNSGFTNRLFWIDGDQHVRVMFDVHARLMPQHVMELYAVVRDVVVRGGSSPLAPEVVSLEATPIHYTQPHDSADDSDSEGNSTNVAESRLSSDTVSEDEFVPETPSGSIDVELGCNALGQSFERWGHGGLQHGWWGGISIGHRFSKREAVLMAVKNYNI